jgi:hypothetical protein
MRPDEALDLIREGEGQTVEFMESFAQQNKAIETLCAMANTDGGVVFLGVRDDGTVVDVSLGQNTLENVSHALKVSTQPHLITRVYQLELEARTVVAAVVEPAPPGTAYYAFNTPYCRSGRTNQLMPPDEQRRRCMATFVPDVTPRTSAATTGDATWQDRERRRVERYQHNRGLFLVHRWRPSEVPGQVADIQIELRQHREGPLTQGVVERVEYHLGPRFADQPLVQTNGGENFRLEVSAYAPFLSLAQVVFNDGTLPVELERYIDF